MEKCVNLNSRGGFMKRNAILKLVQWKNSPERKPMVLRGARQVGKTWLMKEFGQNYYDNYVSSSSEILKDYLPYVSDYNSMVLFSFFL